jgi:hypothetical protein
LNTSQPAQNRPDNPDSADNAPPIADPADYSPQIADPPRAAPLDPEEEAEERRRIIRERTALWRKTHPERAREIALAEAARRRVRRAEQRDLVEVERLAAMQETGYRPAVRAAGRRGVRRPLPPSGLGTPWERPRPEGPQGPS